ncbi:MAG: hypothetical protein ACYDC8_05255 [Gammaproteobacteria bacterium]
MIRKKKSGGLTGAQKDLDNGGIFAVPGVLATSIWSLGLLALVEI